VGSWLRESRLCTRDKIGLSTPLDNSQLAEPQSVVFE
jgi:hypothetical protein